MSDDRAAMPTTGFDAGILDYLNNFARESYPFDVLQVFLSTNHLVKGGLLLALFWWAWFKVQDNAPQRARLGATLVACLAAIILAARRPALFYPLLFLLCYQIADMFNNARAFGELAEVLSQG